jgi:hypothetical protein
VHALAAAALTSPLPSSALAAAACALEAVLALCAVATLLRCSARDAAGDGAAVGGRGSRGGNTRPGW